MKIRTVMLAAILSMGAGYSQSLVVPTLGTPANPTGSGARAMGQGNAFIGVADDATAASWNPAGLTQLESPEFSFAFDYVARHGERHSGTNPEIEGDDWTNWEDLNYLSMVFPFSISGKPAVFSLNYLKMYNFDNQFSHSRNQFVDDGLFTFDIKGNIDYEQTGSFYALSPAFAIDVTPKLTLGVTLNIWNDDITRGSSFKKNYNYTKDQTMTFVPFNVVTQEDSVYMDEQEFIVDEGYSWVIGGMYRFSKELSFGLVLKPSFLIDLEHRGKHLIQTFQGGSLVYEDFQDPSIDTEGELEFPWSAGVGLAWRPNDALTVSADVFWTDWSDYSFTENGSETNPITGQSHSNGKLKDTVSLRFGCEHIFNIESESQILFPVRFGLAYEPRPSVGGTDDFYAISFGGGIQKGNIAFDLAYEYRWGNEARYVLHNSIPDSKEDIEFHRFMASLIYGY